MNTLMVGIIFSGAGMVIYCVWISYFNNTFIILPNLIFNSISYTTLSFSVHEILAAFYIPNYSATSKRRP